MSEPAARLNPATVALLLLPPLLWAGNAIVGRLMQGSIPPVTFNFLRWVLAFVLLLPLAAGVLPCFGRATGIWCSTTRCPPCSGNLHLPFGS